MKKKIVVFLLKLLVTVSLFVLLFRPETYGLSPEFWGENLTVRGLLEEIRGVESQNLMFWLMFAAAVRLMGILCGVVRWRLLLKGQGLTIPFGYALQSWFVGRAIGIFLPGTIGLDGYRLYDSVRYTGEAIRSVTVIVVEKLTGFIALTLLVFLTFPMGFRLIHFNVPMLILTMILLGMFVIVSLLLLLYPRVLRVLIAVLPTPEKLRTKLDKVGAAAAAYGEHRGLLLAAVFFGVLVHVAICMMFFGVMSAIRAPNTTIFDIFFTSPLMIWGTVLGPSVGGEGIREIVFTTILGATSGRTKAFLIGHLGWWAGDVVPFLIGLPIFLFRRVPGKAEIQKALQQAHDTKQAESSSPMLDSEQILLYRRGLLAMGAAGILGGLWAGGACGTAEAAWIARIVPGFTEYRLFPWAVMAYGITFAAAGLVAAVVFAFLSLMRDRMMRPALNCSFVVGLLTCGGTFILGMFRLYRDVLGGHHPRMIHLVGVGTGAVAAGIVLGFAAYFIARSLERYGRNAIVIGLAGYVICGVGAVVSSAIAGSRIPAPAFTPTSGAKGPNIILIGLDALRADALRLYNPEAEAHTPNLDAFACDAIRFSRAFTQAPWTKPSFATIFTGLYPDSHRATSKSAALPLEVTTLAERLRDAGYYTQGFANNPNISVIFQFDQGFVEYVDLKPNLYFGASYSASKLSLYEVLRRVRQKAYEKLRHGKIDVADFYQPAEVVTATALDWLDTPNRTSQVPFYLFLHYMEAHDPYMDWSRPGVGYARVRMEHPDPDRYLTLMRDAYRQEVEHLDRYLGELFEGLRARGLYDDALIVLVSDHGEEFYDHGGWWHGQTLYDELLHVPLFIKLPKNLSGGAVDDTFARHVDLAPTILSLAGIPVTGDLPGTPLLDSSGTPTSRAVGFIYAENDFEGNTLQAVRSADAKIIHANPDNSRNLAPVEFYDLIKDPKEKTNLAGTHDVREQTLADTLSGMQAFIREHAAEPSLHETLPGDLQDQMRSIGYF